MAALACGRDADRASTQERIRSLSPWFHNLHLPDGSQTAPDHFLGDFPACKWRTISSLFAADLRGTTVLDIGCNGGFYAIELARRGATVTAIDSDEHYLQQARWAVEVFDVSRQVTLHRMQVYELAHQEQTYDIVLFLGVLYHLRYPMLGLDIVCRKTRRRLLLQSLTMPGDTVHPALFDSAIDERDHMLESGWPKMAFIEHRLANDPTNWWAPNRACLEAMARSCGMSVIDHPADEMLLLEPDPQNPSCTTTWNREEFLTATGLRRSAGRHDSLGT